MNTQISNVLDFWYSDRIRKQWFSSTPGLDSEIREKYETLWQEAANQKHKKWMDKAEGCLALCIVLDQFPLNMFRGEAKSYSTEQQAVAVTKHAIDSNLDAELADDKVGFLYMPLMHSEHIVDQELSVASFSKRGLKENEKFAIHHRDIVLNYGRFPHRNEILGRESTACEITYLNSKEAFTG